MRRRSIRIAAATLAFGLAVQAEAHDTWILPKAFQVPVGAAVELDMTSGMSFPRNESAVSADRLAESGLRIGSDRRALGPKGTADGALRLSAPAHAQGVAVAWAVSRPRTIDLKPDQVEHYLEEIAAADHAASWRKSGRPAVKETYSKVAKTFVRVGETGGQADWNTPVGLPLEFVPEADPTTYRVGDTAVWRLLWQGAPLPATAVVAVRAGLAKPLIVLPDAAGRVSFRIDGPGPWLVKATRLEAPAKAGVEWTSQFTTVTFHVAGP